jgi:hypothetical protein
MMRIKCAESILPWAAILLIACQICPAQEQNDHTTLQKRLYHFHPNIIIDEMLRSDLVLSLYGSDVNYDVEAPCVSPADSDIHGFLCSLFDSLKRGSCEDYSKHVGLAYLPAFMRDPANCDANWFTAFQYSFKTIAGAQKGPRLFNIGGIEAFEFNVYREQGEPGYAYLYPIARRPDRSPYLPIDIAVGMQFVGDPVHGVFSFVASAFNSGGTVEKALPIPEVAETTPKRLYSIRFNNIYGDYSSQYPVDLSFNGEFLVKDGKCLGSNNYALFTGDSKLERAAVFYIRTLKQLASISSGDRVPTESELATYSERFGEKSSKYMRKILAPSQPPGVTKKPSVSKENLLSNRKILFAMDAGSYAILFCAPMDSRHKFAHTEFIRMKEDDTFEIHGIHVAASADDLFACDAGQRAMRNFIDNGLRERGVEVNWETIPDAKYYWPDPFHPSLTGLRPPGSSGLLK